MSMRSVENRSDNTRKQSAAVWDKIQRRRETKSDLHGRTISRRRHISVALSDQQGGRWDVRRVQRTRHGGRCGDALSIRVPRHHGRRQPLYVDRRPVLFHPQPVAAAETIVKALDFFDDKDLRGLDRVPSISDLQRHSTVLCGHKRRLLQRRIQCNCFSRLLLYTYAVCTCTQDFSMAVRRQRGRSVSGRAESGLGFLMRGCSYESLGPGSATEVRPSEGFMHS